ncbi:MAG: FUSC family protein, partial [Xanthobacteraceae bacterium]
LETYGAEVAALRRDGVTRGLTDDAAERFFAVGFALEQMHNNFSDLGRVVAEWAEPARKAGRGGGQSG